MRLIDAEPIEKFIEDGLNCKDPKKGFGHDAIDMLTEIYCAPTICQPPNTPLTLEELREMDGEPIWIVHTDYTLFGKEYWGIVRDGFSGLPNCFVATRHGNVRLLYSEYGKTWIAYRRKPEKGQ